MTERELQDKFVVWLKSKKKDNEHIFEEVDTEKRTIIKEVKFKHTSAYKTKLAFKGIEHKEKIIGMVVTMSNEKEEMDMLVIICIVGGRYCSSSTKQRITCRKSKEDW